MRKNISKIRVAVLCGGPSLERGISLNSARSVCDHLGSETVELEPVYFDHLKQAYRISRAQLYSNTPSDFDFKLRQSSKPLSATALRKLLKGCDLVFPVMHGPFGEDGEIQRLLEEWHCRVVGSPSAACRLAFDKHDSNEFIRKQGFHALPSLALKAHHSDHLKSLRAFFKTHALKRAIVKPATGGSSIGVYSVSTPEEALEKARELFSKRVDTRVVVEPFCTGKEFTVILLENRFGMPVAILPTEIETDYSDHQIFDYRKKYLATRQVAYHCPPRFADGVVEQIQIQAEQLFTLFGMRDFARFDGWLLPGGRLWFSDFNPISGMEQNSFLFQQSSQIGMSHRDMIRFVVKSACRRYGIVFPDESADTMGKRKTIPVLFGGSTAERQVSLMSGTNVWLKLRRSRQFAPEPYLLDTKERVWKLPYAMTLNHTVEEIEAMCERAPQNEKRLARLKTAVLEKLSPLPREINEPVFLPKRLTLKELIASTDFLFIGLHGGIGENGTLQALCEKAGVRFNGSGAKASRLCMDKYATGMALSGLVKEGVTTAAKSLMKVAALAKLNKKSLRQTWKTLTRELGSPTLIVKPHADGCSAGIARLYGPADLEKYVGFAARHAPCIPQGQLKNQHGLIEMPTEPLTELLFEQFIQTDKARVIGNRLKWQKKSEWIEITMGVVERGGQLHALNPSMTVAIGNVLTLEEKFQGGTGVNITPPPAPFVKPSAVKKARRRMESVARTLGVGNYARIDAFMHTRTGELIVIEANTTPALTPSTVIFHQTLAETPPVYPVEFLESLIHNALK